MYIGKNLIVLRHARRFTQKEIARLAGMSQANYSKIESDIQRQVAVFVRILGVGVDALWQPLASTPGSQAPSAGAEASLVAAQQATIEALRAQIEAERHNWQGLNAPPRENQEAV